MDGFLLLAAWLHRIDPFLVRIDGDLGLRWYGLSYVAGFVAGFALIYYLARSRRSLLGLQQVGDFVFTIALATIIGGRLGYCVFYQPALLVDFGGGFPWWGVLKMWEGGMASHGGVIGILLGCIFYGKRHEVSILHLFDLCAITAPIGIFFGRIANFINGELVGRSVDPQFPLAVKFPQDITDWLYYEPTKLKALTPVIDEAGPAVTGISAGDYQMLAEQAAAGTLSRSMELQLQGVLHRVVETVQSDGPTADALAATLRELPALTARHPSQLYAAALEGLAVWLVLAIVWIKPRRPGILGAGWLISYGSVRIIQEQFRRPDLHLGYQWLGLTRGQWLSVGLVVAGLILLAIWARRPVPKIGGWLGRADEAPTVTTAAD